MRERHQLFFGLWLVSKELHHSAIQTKIVRHFGGFFHQITVRQQIGRHDSMQPVKWSQQAGGWAQFCMKRLRTLKLFQIFSTEIKKSKTYSGLCPFKGLSNGTTLMQIQSGRTVPITLLGLWLRSACTKQRTLLATATRWWRKTKMATQQTTWEHNKMAPRNTRGTKMASENWSSQHEAGAASHQVSRTGYPACVRSFPAR